MRFVGALVGTHQCCDQRRAATIGQPHLLTGDGVGAVLVLRATGADGSDVGSEFGFRHRERTPGLTGGHPRQEALLLLVGAVLADHVGHDEVGVDHPGHAHPAAGEFLHAQRIGEQRLAQPAVLFRDHQSEQPHLLHRVDDGLRVGVGALQLRSVRDDLFVDELPYRGQDLGLELGKTESLGESGHEPNLSKTAATPCPPPMHMVSRP